MKNSNTIFISIILILSIMLMLFVGCNKSIEEPTLPIEESEDNNNQGNNVENNNDQGSNEQNANINVTQFSLNFLSDLMVDTNSVTAYGIKQSSEDIGNVSDNPIINTKVSMLSSTLLDDRISNDSHRKPKYSLFQTTEQYYNGNVEYNENSISKVTFKKNTSATEEIYDNNGNLITTDTKITQEDLDAQINKVYTTNRYTFLQFIAMVDNSGTYPYCNSNKEIEYEDITVRPSSMTYDENGVAEFDKTDYFSSNLTASFVIDNETGFIYKIENFYIKSFHNGLVVDEKGYYYIIKTNENQCLTFTDILPNKDCKVNNAVFDNYGWTYVANDLIDSIDNENKVVYTTIRDKYIVDSRNNVYEFQSRYSIPNIMLNGVSTKLDNTELIIGIKNLFTNYWSDCEGILAYNKDCIIFNFNLYTQQGIIAIQSKNGILYVDDTISKTNYYWLENKYNVIIQSIDNEIHYKIIDFDDRVSFGKEFTKLSDMKLFKAKDYYLEVGKDNYKVNNVFYSAGVNGTQYYQIIETENGLELKELQSKSYLENVFIFQPINK